MASRSTPGSGGTPRILHLEDNAKDRDLVLATLEKEGILLPVVSATTREEFQAVLSQESIALVLSDVALPGFDGLAALELARSHRPNLPFIFVSDPLEEEAAIENLHQGATDYVLKDRLSRLGPAIRRALREADAREIQARGAETIANRQRFINAMLESLDAGIIACDPEGTITVVNRAAREMTGLPAPPIPAGRWAEYCQLYERGSQRALSLEEDPLAKVLRGEHVRTVEMVLRPTGGRGRTVLVSGQMITGPQGESRGAVIAFHDVTDRKTLEERLQQAQKLEAVGSLAGGIAHDFNNLLTVICGYAEMILGRLKPEDPVRGSAAEIKKAGDRGASLTHQLLAFSRKQVVEPRILDLNAVFLDMKPMLHRLLPANIKLVARLAENPASVRADPGQVEQVIVNLVVNARDAMPSGGQLTVDIRNEYLDEFVRDVHPDAEPGSYVALGVTDTGIGMSPETKARIFEPFFTTKELGKGTGLGLSTVYGIVKQAGGSIWVYSEPNLGTTFKVYLPQVAAASEELHERPQGLEALGGGETVLVAEDDPMVRSLVRQVLEGAGYSVLEAPDGDAALGICRQSRGIDLVLSDVMMPGMIGPDLVVRIREIFPACRELYMSGYAGELSAPSRGAAKSLVLLQKPFGREALLQRVREALDEKSY